MNWLGPPGVSCCLALLLLGGVGAGRGVFWLLLALVPTSPVTMEPPAGAEAVEVIESRDCAWLALLPVEEPLEADADVAKSLRPWSAS